MSSNSPSSKTSRISFTLRVVIVLFVALPSLLLILHRPTAFPEVLSLELARRDGLLYRGQQTQPFTGFMLEKYPDDVLKSRSMIRDGVLDGLSEGWHTNGQLQVRESFKKGVSHGVREKWHENGVKLSEGSIVDGKHDGIFRRWHENGILAEEVNMGQGEPNGLSRAFYPSGYLKTRATIKHGKVVEQKSWADGEMKESTELAKSR